MLLILCQIRNQYLHIADNSFTVGAVSRNPVGFKGGRLHGKNSGSISDEFCVGNICGQQRKGLSHQFVHGGKIGGLHFFKESG